MSDGCFRVDHSKGVGHLQILHCAYREQAQGEPRFRRMDYCCEWGASLMSLSDRYRRACTDETDAMIGWLKNRRNLTQKRFRKPNRMSGLRAMTFPPQARDWKLPVRKAPKRWPKTIKVWAMRPPTLELSLGAFLSTFLIDCPSSKQNWLKRSVCSHSVSPRRMTKRVRIFCSPFGFIPMACCLKRSLIGRCFGLSLRLRDGRALAKWQAIKTVRPQTIQQTEASLHCVNCSQHVSRGRRGQR